MKYWLMKCEPDCYSIDDLARDKTTEWTGVRNYQARNFMSKEMAQGDVALFYHSNAEPSGVAGLMTIHSDGAIVDTTALDKKDDHFEPRATRENPIWYCVAVKFQEKFKNFVPLSDLRANAKLKGMLLLQKGSRLSVLPVTKSEFLEVLKMAESRHKI